MLRAMWARVEIAEQAQIGMRKTEEEAVREWDEIRWLSGMFRQTIPATKMRNALKIYHHFESDVGARLRWRNYSGRLKAQSVQTICLIHYFKGI